MNNFLLNPLLSRFLLCARGLRQPGACLAWLVVIALASSGCSLFKQSAKDVEVEDRTVASQEEESGQLEGDTWTQAVEKERVEIATLDEGRENLLEQRSIYFEFDSDELQPDYRRVVEAHAAYITSKRNPSLTLEGHADERGTREYNLALGERRGMVIKRLLTLLGVPASRVRVVSYGEERPYAKGHDEQSWYLNRRVDLVY